MKKTIETARHRRSPGQVTTLTSMPSAQNGADSMKLFPAMALSCILCIVCILPKESKEANWLQHFATKMLLSLRAPVMKSPITTKQLMGLTKFAKAVSAWAHCASCDSRSSSFVTADLLRHIDQGWLTNWGASSNQWCLMRHEIGVSKGNFWALQELHVSLGRSPHHSPGTSRAPPDSLFVGRLLSLEGRYQTAKT